MANFEDNNGTHRHISTHFNAKIRGKVRKKCKRGGNEKMKILYNKLEIGKYC